MDDFYRIGLSQPQADLGGSLFWSGLLQQGGPEEIVLAAILSFLAV